MNPTPHTKSSNLGKHLLCQKQSVRQKEGDEKEKNNIWNFKMFSKNWNKMKI